MFEGRDTRSVPNGWTMSETYIVVGGVGQWVLTAALRYKPGNGIKMIRGSNAGARLNMASALPSLPPASIPTVTAVATTTVLPCPRLKRVKTQHGFPEIEVIPVSIPKIEAISEITKCSTGDVIVKAQLFSSHEIGKDEIHVGDQKDIKLNIAERQKGDVCKAASNFLNQLVGDMSFCTDFETKPSDEWLLSIMDKRKTFLQQQKLDKWIVQEIISLKFHVSPSNPLQSIGVAKTLTSDGEKMYVVNKALCHPDFLMAFVSFVSSFSNKIITYAHQSIEYFSAALPRAAFGESGVPLDENNADYSA